MVGLLGKYRTERECVCVQWACVGDTICVGYEYVLYYIDLSMGAFYAWTGLRDYGYKMSGIDHYIELYMNAKRMHEACFAQLNGSHL